jgi:hypothetical protein
MRKVLTDFACYEDRVTEVEEEGGVRRQIAAPRIPVIGKLRVSSLDNPLTTVEVRALLDTGNDITIISPDKVRELEELLNQDIFQLRKVRYWGMRYVDYEPAYPLALVFSEEGRYSSLHGFITPSEDNWDFEDFDMWIGRDIFNQLIVTFDGERGTVTILDRNS